MIMVSNTEKTQESSFTNQKPNQRIEITKNMQTVNNQSESNSTVKFVHVQSILYEYYLYQVYFFCKAMSRVYRMILLCCVDTLLVTAVGYHWNSKRLISCRSAVLYRTNSSSYCLHLGTCCNEERREHRPRDRFGDSFVMSASSITND